MISPEYAEYALGVANLRCRPAIERPRGDATRPLDRDGCLGLFCNTLGQADRAGATLQNPPDAPPDASAGASAARVPRDTDYCVPRSDPEACAPEI